MSVVRQYKVQESSHDKQTHPTMTKKTSKQPASGQARFTNQNQSVCSLLRSAVVNATLPAFAAERRAAAPLMPKLFGLV